METTTTPAQQATPPAAQPPAAPFVGKLEGEHLDNFMKTGLLPGQAAPAAPAATTPIDTGNAAPLGTPAATTTSTPTVQPKEILGEEFASWDEVKTVLTKSKEAESKVAELEKNLKENEFANEEIRALNKAAKSGVSRESFDMASKADTAKMTPQQILSMDLQVSKGLSKEDADFRVSQKYKLGEEFLESDPTVRDARIEMKIDAQDAKERVDAFRVDKLTPEPVKLAEKKLAAWEPVLPQVMETIKTIPLEVEGMAYPVSPELLKKATDHARKFVSSELLNLDPTTPEGKETVQNVLQAYVWANEGPKMLRYQATEIEKKYIAKEVNLRKPEGEQGAPPLISKEQHLANSLASLPQFRKG